MEGHRFQFVCTRCLCTRGVLESEVPPPRCPDCGTRDPWAGPFATARFVSSPAGMVIDSPFYVAALRNR